MGVGIYPTGEQLSTNADQKAILLAMSGQVNEAKSLSLQQLLLQLVRGLSLGVACYEYLQLGLHLFNSTPVTAARHYFVKK